MRMLQNKKNQPGLPVDQPGSEALEYEARHTGHMSEKPPQGSNVYSANPFPGLSSNHGGANSPPPRA
jgi:hypothetical protein